MPLSHESCSEHEIIEKKADHVPKRPMIGKAMHRQNRTKSKRVATPAPIRKSLSFLQIRDLMSYKSLPLLGAACYMGSSIGTTAMRETFTRSVSYQPIGA